MSTSDVESLSAVVDAVNEAFFYGRALSHARRERMAKQIASRQGLPGSYAGMFAPAETDFKQGIRFFTGERIKTRAGTAHILGEEACRALILLDVNAASVRDALERATVGMVARLKAERRPGMYCCGKCSCAYWRHLSVGGLENSQRRLAEGMNALKSHRDGQGRWQTFPYYYTLLALSELDLPSAIKEMRYAAEGCEQYLKRTPSDDKYAQRRQALAERVLAKC